VTRSLRCADGRLSSGQPASSVWKHKLLNQFSWWYRQSQASVLGASVPSSESSRLPSTRTRHGPSLTWRSRLCAHACMQRSTRQRCSTPCRHPTAAIVSDQSKGLPYTSLGQSLALPVDQGIYYLCCGHQSCSEGWGPNMSSCRPPCFHNHLVRTWSPVIVMVKAALRRVRMNCCAALHSSKTSNLLTVVQCTSRLTGAWSKCVGTWSM